MFGWTPADRPRKPVRVGVKFRASDTSSKAKGQAPAKRGSGTVKPVVVGAKSGRYGDNLGTWPKANLTNSQFKFKQDGTKYASHELCKAVRPGNCAANEGYRNGRRVLRFCVSKDQKGHVVDIEGMTPGQVHKLATAACAEWRKSGKYPATVPIIWRKPVKSGRKPGLPVVVATPVGEAALGGVRRRKKAAKRSRR